MASQRCDIQAGHGAVRQDMAWPAGSGGLCDAALKKKPERLLGTLRKGYSDCHPCGRRSILWPNRRQIHDVSGRAYFNHRLKGQPVDAHAAPAMARLHPGTPICRQVLPFRLWPIRCSIAWCRHQGRPGSAGSGQSHGRANPSQILPETRKGSCGVPVYTTVYAAACGACPVMKCCA